MSTRKESLLIIIIVLEKVNTLWSRFVNETCMLSWGYPDDSILSLGNRTASESYQNDQPRKLYVVKSWSDRITSHKWVGFYTEEKNIYDVEINFQGTRT